MKRLFTIAVIAATLLSCSKDEGLGTKETVSVIAHISDQDQESLAMTRSFTPATRIAPDDAAQNKWKFHWEAGDKLYQPDGGTSYTLTIDDATSENPTFTGSGLKTDKAYYLFTVQYAKYDGDNRQYLMKQDGELSIIPMVSTQKVDLSSTSTAQEVDMKHMGAFVKFSIAFNSDLAGYTLDNVVVDGFCASPTSLNTFSDYLGDDCDLDSAISNCCTDKLSIEVTPSGEFEKSGDSYIIPIAIYPTIVSETEAIELSLALKDGSGNLKYANLSVSPADASMTEFNFERATVSRIYFECSASDISDFKAGSGTAEDPYELSSAADLETLKRFINNGSDDNNIHYKLTSDIDLNGSAENQFTPIGGFNKQFRGTFDGDGHTIKGLYIDNSSSYQALFGYTDGATIKNLGVEGTVKSSSYNISGIVGKAAGTSTIINCFSNVNIESTTTNDNYIGGIAGQTNGAKIINCYNLGSVKGDGYTIGGIVGECASEMKMQSCYNAGNINSEDSQWTGSIIGYSSCYSFDVSECYFLSGTHSTGLGSHNSSKESSTTSVDNMQTQAFVDTLNDAAAKYNTENPTKAQACMWKLPEGGGFPVHNFHPLVN